VQPSRSSNPLERGERVGTALVGAWRDSPPSWSVSPGELAELAPLLLRGGADALVWRRLRDSALRSTPSCLPLHQAYRFHYLRDAVHEYELRNILRRIRSSGVEPILAKGWAAARLYPEPGLRPYTDFDLYVPAGEHSAALSSLMSWEHPAGPVDLHCGFRDLEDRSVQELYARSRTIDLEGTRVRIFGPEDHLRLICLHLLRHGASRPLWLCDVGAALESRPADFDWDYFLRGDPVRSEYVTATLGLAHRLLGARIEETPAAGEAQNLPAWLVSTVLKEWGAGFRRREPMRSYVGRTSGVLRELSRHWPNPIEASARMGAPFNWMPRLPFQIANSLMRTARFANRTS